jgi:ATP-dependent Clp protease ATP-binding subunit ClpC
MFERFTERARHAVVLAQDEARALRHDYIGTEHLLLGLLREDEGLGARALTPLGIALDGMRERVVAEIGRGDEAIAGQIPFTPRAKKALELALREARSFGHDYIGTEHVLLGLVRVDDGVAARLLREAGADAETVRGNVISLLGGHTVFPSRPPAPPPKDAPSRAAPRALLPALFAAALAVGVLVGWLIWG